MARTKNLNKQIVIRVSDDLLDQLERDAASNGRTLAQTVRFLLSQRLTAA